MVKRQSRTSGHAEVLSLVGIPRVARLLSICGNKNERKALAERCGIDEALLIRWARMAESSSSSSDSGKYNRFDVAGVSGGKGDELQRAEDLPEKMAEVSADPK